MPFYSISLQKPGRVGEPKTTFNEGNRPPTTGEAIEIRVNTDAYRIPSSPQQHSPVAFWADLHRLMQRMRERGEPRPEFAGPVTGDNTYVDAGYVDTGYVE